MVMSFKNFSDEAVRRISNVCGVYALAVGLKDTDAVQIFYIGSGDIGERLRAHLSYNEPNECIKENVEKYQCYYWFEEVQGGADRRKRREAELIDHYCELGQAKCNKISP